MEIFTPWITKILLDSEHPFVNSAQGMISYFFEIENLIPDRYGWRYYNVESFNQLVGKTNKSPIDINRVFWLDVIRSLEAYSVITYIRTNEVLRTAIRSLNDKEIVPAAILTRSLLELAASIIENGNIINHTIKTLNPPADTVVISEEIEKFVTRIIWGTRFGDEIPEHLKQKNILTTIQKLSKKADASELLNKYEYLCELAHPNIVGNARFWSEDSILNDDGSVTISVQKKGYSESKKELIENIVWAMGWSATCVRNGFHLIQDTMINVEEKFPGTLIDERK